MSTTSKHKTILLAMSGGTDSSMAALLLIKQGYVVKGLTMVMFDDADGQLPNFVNEAAQMAQSIGIEHFVVDVRQSFNAIVRQYFVGEYANGRTPNPGVRCNEQIKWAVLAQKADELGCDEIATGHYAQVVQRNGFYYIAKGTDAVKDQSYFLYRLPQAILKRTVLPLGTFTKNEVKDYASHNGFENLANKGESMSVCFMNGLPLDDFLSAHLPNDLKVQGSVVDRCGIPIGSHKGAAFYTVGQTKGLSLDVQTDWCVVGIDTSKNKLVAGPSWVLQKQELRAHQLSFANINDIDPQHIYHIKVRGIDQVPYHEGYVAIDGDTATIKFLTTVWGITPGQSVVIYDGTIILGGGIIV